MSRFQQRLRRTLQNPKTAEGYLAAEAEQSLRDAFEQIRQHQQLSKEELARRMECSREDVSHLLTAPDSNPTLETLLSMFQALDVTAHITFHQAAANEPPIQTRVLFPQPSSDVRRSPISAGAGDASI